MLVESIDGFKYEMHIAYDLLERVLLIGLVAPE